MQLHTKPMNNYQQNNHNKHKVGFFVFPFLVFIQSRITFATRYFPLRMRDAKTHTNAQTQNNIEFLLCSVYIFKTSSKKNGTESKSNEQKVWNDVKTAAIKLQRETFEYVCFIICLCVLNLYACLCYWIV